MNILEFRLSSAFLLLLVAVALSSCTKTYHIEVTSADATMGTASGTGDYTANKVVDIQALPASGYVFVRWNDDNTNNPRKITVSSDLKFVAYFEKYEEGPLFDIGTVTDREGNEYPTLNIGELWWMAENLKVKSTPDGQAVPSGSGAVSHTTPLYYWSTSRQEMWYNWSAADIVCPEGWRLPSSDEWAAMEAEVGRYAQFRYEGDPAKIAKALSVRNDWQSSSIPGTPGCYQMYNNATGFRAVPMGRVAGGTSLTDRYVTANFWTSDIFNDSIARSRTLSYDAATVEPTYNKKNVGLSVRCVRDFDSPGGQPDDGGEGDNNGENPWGL